MHALHLITPFAKIFCYQFKFTLRHKKASFDNWLKTDIVYFASIAEMALSEIHMNG